MLGEKIIQSSQGLYRQCYCTRDFFFPKIHLTFIEPPKVNTLNYSMASLQIKSTKDFVFPNICFSYDSTNRIP